MQQVKKTVILNSYDDMADMLADWEDQRVRAFFKNKRDERDGRISEIIPAHSVSTVY